MKYKFGVVALVLAYGLWFLLIGGKQLSTEGVRTLYADLAKSVEQGDRLSICSLFAEELVAHYQGTLNGSDYNETLDRGGACGAIEGFIGAQKQMELTLHHPVKVVVRYAVQSVALSSDRRSATAEVSFDIRVTAGSATVLTVHTLQTDRFRRNFGFSRWVESKGRLTVERPS